MLQTAYSASSKAYFQPTPNGVLPIQLGSLKATIMGGPYLAKPEGYCGVKMAAEINAPCVISIPTRDFSVPPVALFRMGLLQALTLLHQRQKLYVGCMGGVGRTGLFMGGLVKVVSEYRRKTHRSTLDPKLYVREKYQSHAIETQKQEQYLEDLDVSDLVEWVWVYQRMHCN